MPEIDDWFARQPATRFFARLQTRFALRWGRRLYVWGVVRVLADLDAAEVRRLATREMDAIVETIEAHFQFQDREARILSERLARRYDVAQAVNESANRAIADKQAARIQLTAQQEKALDLQKQTVAERIKNS